MPKNKLGGNKSKKLKNHIIDTFNSTKMPLATDIKTGEPRKLYGQIKKLLGSNRTEILCDDGEFRPGLIPGSMRKKIWIYIDDIVLIQFRDCETDKTICDILYKYNKIEIKHLNNLNVLNFIVNDFVEQKNEIDNDVVNFDEI